MVYFLAGAGVFAVGVIFGSAITRASVDHILKGGDAGKERLN